uniref:Uncharacterized protein n=1 Tax=Amazona collaria TaxID=241587 RepID=A0A8B9FLM2_9PSIT
MTTTNTVYLGLSFCSGHAAQGRGEGCYYLPSYVWVTPAIGMFGQLDTVQSKHNLMIPEQRSLNLFTRNPPRNVPPPPAGTTRYPGKRGKTHKKDAEDIPASPYALAQTRMLVLCGESIPK